MIFNTEMVRGILTERKSVMRRVIRGVEISWSFQGLDRDPAAFHRLTPLECERLQGFPDGWTDIAEFTDKYGIVHKTKGWMDESGKWHKDADSPRYKALGNSVALPPWKWVLKRLCAFYERDATMGSLFDGIGGFPLIWERLNGPGTCLWASEIEPFCIAVTKKRFGGTAEAWVLK